jgi:hypothetical protein
MKKTILLIMLSGFFVTPGSAQKLLDIYKNGPVKLIADKTYGAKNNWESLFNLYYDTITKNVGREEDKKIVVAPDGSVFMSHRNRYVIWKFGPDGNYLKKVGARGSKPDQFSKMPTIFPVVDGKYLIASGDVNGQIKFFDLEGTLFKTYTLNYNTGNFTPYGNGEILFERSVLLKTDRLIPPGSIDGWKHSIANLNLYTGKIKTVFEGLPVKDISFPKSQNIDSLMKLPPEASKIFLPNAYLFKAPVYTILNDGRFLLSNRETGAVKLLDQTGREIKKFNLDITPVPITEKDVLEHYESTKKLILRDREYALTLPDLPEDKNVGGVVTWAAAYPDKKALLARIDKAFSMVEDLRNMKGYYPHLPFFSNMITDDEGNLLVFEFTSSDQKETNIFNVIAYNNDGKKVARTSFICDDYDLNFSESTFLISKGYVYAVAKLKNFKGMPLRLVRFKISN